MIKNTLRQRSRVEFCLWELPEKPVLLLIHLFAHDHTHPILVPLKLYLQRLLGFVALYVLGVRSSSYLGEERGKNRRSGKSTRKIRRKKNKNINCRNDETDMNLNNLRYFCSDWVEKMEFKGGRRLFQVCVEGMQQEVCLSVSRTPEEVRILSSFPGSLRSLVVDLEFSPGVIFESPRQFYLDL